MPDAPPPNEPPTPGRRRLLIAAGYTVAGAVAATRLRGGSGGGKGEHISATTRRKVPPPAVADAPGPPPDDHLYDMVLAGGRVIDPETGFDQVANVGVDGRTISTIDSRALKGKNVIDVTGRVVAPGFIDLLSYEPDDKGTAFKLQDGVTTNLGMHGINANASDFFGRYTGNCLVNFGGAFDNPFVRSTLFNLDAGEEPSESTILEMAEECEKQLSQGWIGVDFEPEYSPGTSFAEMVALARVAERNKVPVFIHGRFSAVGTNAATLDEVINLAKETGAAVHVEHIISTGGTYDMANSLNRLEKAVDDGYDITACMYPYDYWATYLGSTRFAPGWQERFAIDYQDLQIAGTPDRLTPESFRQAQRDNKLAAAYAIPPGDVTTCLQSPLVMIGSDAILTNGNNHPRATGCFARVLGKYVRDEGTIDIATALAKMTIMPAKRLETRAPALKKKGRLQRGADADITVFDAATISDRSTVEDPAIPSTGIDWVFVLGVPMMTPLGVNTNDHVGEPIAFQT